MTRRGERIRNLKDNRVLFLHLLEKNTAAKFHEMLAEHPMHNHICYSTDVGQVSL